MRKHIPLARHTLGVTGPKPRKCPFHEKREDRQLVADPTEGWDVHVGLHPLFWLEGRFTLFAGGHPTSTVTSSQRMIQVLEIGHQILDHSSHPTCSSGATTQQPHVHTEPAFLGPYRPLTKWTWWFSRPFLGSATGVPPPPRLVGSQRTMMIHDAKLCANQPSR